MFFALLKSMGWFKGKIYRKQCFSPPNISKYEVKASSKATVSSFSAYPGYTGNLMSVGSALIDSGCLG